MLRKTELIMDVEKSNNDNFPQGKMKVPNHPLVWEKQQHKWGKTLSLSNLNKLEWLGQKDVRSASSWKCSSYSALQNLFLRLKQAQKKGIKPYKEFHQHLQKFMPKPVKVTIRRLGPCWLTDFSTTGWLLLMRKAKKIQITISAWMTEAVVRLHSNRYHTFQ